MKRELGTLERALVLIDQYAPFHIVSILHLEGAPAPQIVRNALKVLQNGHPFLSARLLQERGRYYLVKLIEPGLIFHVLPRWNDGHWVQVVEVEMGNRIDILNGPLFRCTYLYDPTHQRAEIILTLCHAIADAASTARLMHELLKVCASFSDEKTVPVRVTSPAPPVESRFPSPYHGPRFVLHRMRYAFGQLGDEISYRMRMHGKRIPSIHHHPVRGRILSIHLPKDLLEALLHRARQEEVTLNSILNAAMMIAVNRELYAGQQAPMRTFSFTNLRSYVDPLLDDEELASYTSQLRYTIQVEGGIDFWTLARDLHRKIYASLMAGDMFVAAAMTEPLMQMVIELKSFRISTTALNYKEAVPIDANYGSIKVTEVHEFVSAYDLGPELSAQAHIFNNQLFWDFVYLDEDMTRDEAVAITEEIRTILSHAVGK